eukprot:GHVO01010095.1.p1 GENE.GHVO01010095.1~~GHVO01010095.1.p1  ORF type:complete len:385 (-),score=89.37 GHVO01010095.1:278-1432(-)
MIYAFIGGGVSYGSYQMGLSPPGTPTSLGSSPGDPYTPRQRSTPASPMRCTSPRPSLYGSDEYTPRIRVADVVYMTTEEALAITQTRQADRVPPTAPKFRKPSERSTVVHSSLVHPRILEARARYARQRTLIQPSESFIRSRDSARSVTPSPTRPMTPSPTRPSRDAVTPPPTRTPYTSYDDLTADELNQTPRTREEVKVKMQDLAKEFAQEAVHGMDLWCLSKALNWMEIPVVLFADEGLRHFRFFAPKGIPRGGADALPISNGCWSDIDSIYRGRDIPFKHPSLGLPVSYYSRTVIVSIRDYVIICVWKNTHGADTVYTGMNIMKSVQPYLSLLKVQANIRMRLKQGSLTPPPPPPPPPPPRGKTVDDRRSYPTPPWSRSCR